MDSRESSERYEDIWSIVFSPDGSEFSTVVVYNWEFRLIKWWKMLSDKIYEMPTIVYSPDSKEISYISYAKAYSKWYWISKWWKVGKKYYMCNPPLYSSNWKIFWYTAEKEQVNQNSALKIEKERDYNDHLLTLTDNFLIVNWLELPFPKVDNFTYLNKLDSWVVPPLSEWSETILVTIKNIDTEWKIYRQLEIVDNTYAIIRELDYDEAGKLFSVNNKFKYIKLIPGKESKETKWEWLDWEFIEWSKYIQLSNWKKYIRTLVWI